MEVSPPEPDEFTEFSRREIAKWARQVKDAGIKPERVEAKDDLYF